jgi:hypothetical protein
VTGLLIRGKLEPVEGMTIIPPASHGGPVWAALSAGDYRARSTTWVRQVIVHTTKGLWPQRVLPGSGPPGRAQVVADFWRGDPVHSAAHLVVDQDGTVVCLCDLAESQAYHAEGSNPWSIGIEMYQQSTRDGAAGIYEATLAATVLLVAALTEIGGHFDIPAQCPHGPYSNRPISRMEQGSGILRHNIGGATMVGVFGHRDNTSERGRGDPGDEVFRRLLVEQRFEGLDYDRMEDRERGHERQEALNRRGERLEVDGIVGPASIAAMRRQGFARWRDVV